MKLNFEVIADQVFALVKQYNISAAELGLQQTTGFSVNVLQGEVETIEHCQEKNLQITLYHDQRSVSVSTTDLTPTALQTTIEKAVTTLPYMNQDSFAGLAEADLMAYDYANLQLCHEWSITTKEAIEMALQCEAIALKYHPDIKRSEGAGVSNFVSSHLYANTHGFIGQYPTSSHSLSCSVVAEKNSQMQRDYEYTAGRDPKKLWSIEEVAIKAAQKTVQRLGARRISTRRCPVIFSPTLAKGLLGQFVGAISGGNLFRKASFLVDHLGKTIFPANINIFQEPHLKGAMGSAPFDAEGVNTLDQHYIHNGVLVNYVLGSYSARKLGLKTTGNAGGVFNLAINQGPHDLNALLKQMDTGLLVTELLGQGVNLLTGDYSRGAFGYWVEKGEIQFPVEEITIASNLRDMFLGLVAVANDVDNRGSIRTGSMLLEEMTIGGE